MPGNPKGCERIYSVHVFTFSFLYVDDCVGIDGIFFDDFSAGVEFNGDIDGLMLAEAEMALGQGCRAVAVETLAAIGCDLLVPEKFFGGGIGDADFGAGGSAISFCADGTDAEPVLFWEIISQNHDTFFFASGARCAGDQ